MIYWLFLRRIRWLWLFHRSMPGQKRSPSQNGHFCRAVHVLWVVLNMEFGGYVYLTIWQLTLDTKDMSKSRSCQLKKSPWVNLACCDSSPHKRSFLTKHMFLDQFRLRIRMVSFAFTHLKNNQNEHFKKWPLILNTKNGAIGGSKIKLST